MNDTLRQRDLLAGVAFPALAALVIASAAQLPPAALRVPAAGSDRGDVRAHAGSAAPPDLLVIKDARPLMGTVFQITAATRRQTRETASPMLAKAFQEVARLEQLLSEWREGSEVSEINRNAGVRPVAVSEETFEVVRHSLGVSRLSSGAFDITFNALWGLWDFRRQPPRLPDPEEILRRLPWIDFKRVSLDATRRTVFLQQRGMKIGLGGAGKGYAVDRVSALLGEHGVSDFIVDAGGELCVSGSRGAEPWRVGLRHPRTNGLLCTMEMTGVHISTSGDYERYFELDGRRYHHLIDPKSGWPVRGVASVTVVADSGMRADALSTAAFVLGVERGLALLERTPGVHGLIVDDRLRVRWTSGLELAPDSTGGIPAVRLARRAGARPDVPR